MPSTVCPFAKAVDNVPFVVVATRTASFTLRPCATPSTYDLFAASPSFDGVNKLIILELLTFSCAEVAISLHSEVPLEFWKSRLSLDNIAFAIFIIY